MHDANAARRTQLRDIIGAVQAAVDPESRLLPKLAALDRRRYLIVGAGKAAAKMAKACESVLESAEGLVIVPDGHSLPTKRIEVVEAAHPTPDARGVAATRRIMDLCALGRADEIIVLLSGGASALLVHPATGVSLEDKRRLTNELLRSGASIAEFNAVRKHISQVKGGRLAELAAAPTRTFAISDVPGDNPEIIGSGPTVADPSTLEEARAALERFRINPPPSIIAALKDAANETPKSVKPGKYELIAGPSDAVAAAARAAEAIGYAALTFPYLAGDASAIAKEHIALARRCGANGHRTAIISGGELSVSLGGVSAIGGRCREYLLAIAATARDLAPSLSGAAWDTDGIDGKGQDAGAFLFPDTAARAASAGVSAAEALEAHRSGEFFRSLGDEIALGPTLTNVGDMRVILVDP